MRRSISLFLAIAGLMAVASPASAGQPTRDPVVIPSAFLVFAAGTACEFPIHVDVLVNRETIKTWTDANGNLVRDIITGSLWIRVVNDTTGASTELNVGGPGRDVYASDGSLIQYFHGHGLPIFDGVFYGTIGSAAFALDANFALVEVGVAHGQVIDVCGLID